MRPHGPRPRARAVPIAALLLAACSPSPDPAASLAAARARLDAGDAAAAAGELEALLEELDPKSSLAGEAEAALLRARLAAAPEGGAPPDLAERLLDLSRRHPYALAAGEWPPSTSRLARLGDVDGALEVLRAGLARHPADPGWPTAVDSIRESLQGEPRAPRGLWMLGQVLLEHFDRGRETPWLERALDAFLASLELGGVDPATGRRDESVVVEPEDRLQANLGQGWCYFWRGVLEDAHDYETPRAIFAQVAEVFPESAEARVGLGVALMHAGRLEEARAALEAATALDPESPEAWFDLGQVHVRATRWDAARTAFERAAALRPEHADTLVWLAVSLAEQGRSDQPRELLLQALELDPRNAEAMVQLGIVHARDRSFEQALSWLDRALQIDARNGQAYLQRGKVLLALGEALKASSSLHQAIQLLPESFEAHYNLGVLMAGLGATGDAVRYLEQARELLPPGSPLGPGIDAEVARLRAGG